MFKTTSSKRVVLFVAVYALSAVRIWAQEDDYEFPSGIQLGETGESGATWRLAEGFEGLDAEPGKDSSIEPIDGAGGFDNVAPRLGSEAGPGGLDWDPSPGYRTRYKGGTDYAVGSGMRLQGNNWFMGFPYLTYDSGTNEYRLRYGANVFRVFTNVDSTTWVGKYENVNAKLKKSGSDLYLYDTRGKKYTFLNSDSLQCSKIEGLGAGPQITISYSGSTITVLQKPTATGGSEVRRFTYTITSTRLDKIEIEEKVSGSWTLYRKIDFTYRESGDTTYVESSVGDLIAIKEERLLSPASTWEEKKWVFKYYNSTWSLSNRGHLYQVRSVLGPQSVHDYEAANPSTGIHTQTTAQLASYVDRIYKYGIDKRVTEIDFKSGCGCGGGEGVYAYTWEPNNGTISDLNTWAYRVTITLPAANGSSKIIDYNQHGQLLNLIHQEVAGNSSSRRWIRTWTHDTTGRLTESFSAKACTSYTDSTHVVTTNTTAGQRLTFAYDSNSALTTVKLRDPANGNLNYQLKKAFSLVTSGDRKRFVKTSQTVYPSETTTDTGGVTTSWTYTYHTSDALAVKKRTTTLPAVPTGENGSGTAVSLYEYFETDGLNTWHKDGDGFVHYTGFDSQRQTVTKTVRNIDTDTADRPSGVPAPPSGEGFDSSTGLNIVSDFTYDFLRRRTKAEGPAFNAWDGTSITSTRTTQQWYYSKLSGGETVTIAYPHLGSAYIHVMLSITVQDFEGQVVTSAQGSLSTSYRNTSLSDDLDATQSTLANAFKGQITMRTDSVYDGGKLTQSQVWTDADDSSATKYTTTNAYDAMGRQEKVTTPAGTITKTSFDVLNRPKTTKVGTVDGGGSDNMTLVSEEFYDDEEDTSTNVGDGNLTRVKKHTTYTSSVPRVTNFTYDYRQRLTQTDEPLSVQETKTYDNLNRVKVTSRNDTTSGTVLMAKSESFFDVLGRVYEARISGVSGGTESGYINTKSWLNARGLTIKTLSQGKVFQKTQYDGAGRATNSALTYDTAETAYGDADDLTGDTVIEETRYVPDATGGAELVGHYQRRHNGSGTGALTVGTSGNGRGDYAATWYDPFHRTTHAVSYGTNSGTDLTSRPTGSPPSSSDSTKLVAKISYYVKGNGSGEPTVHIAESLDPMGYKYRTESNDAGQQTKKIDNYVDGTPGTDDDRTVEYTYNTSGQQDKIIAKATTHDQQTQYVWGITRGSDHNLITSNDYYRVIKLPDPSTGSPSVNLEDWEQYNYNAQGELVFKREPSSTTNSLEHVYDFDDRGRQIHDRVDDIPTEMDGTILRISTTYDALDRPIKVSSYDNKTVGSGTVKNEVQYEYSRFDQVLKIYQEWTAAVNTGSSPKVEFAYSFPTDGTTGMRRSSTTYPDGTSVTEEYDSGMDDTLSRVSGRKQGGSWLFQDSYLGMGRLVEREYGSTSPTAKWTLGDPTSQVDYPGLDIFGRSDDLTVVRNGTNTNRYQYTCNYNSQITVREDLVGNISGSYEFDATFSYDALGRLTEHKRGVYSGGSMSTVRLKECFTMNRSGGVTLYGTDTADTCNTTTSFSFNDINETTAQGGTSLVYNDPGDQVGAVTNDYVYDAWHRITEATDGATPPTTLSKYVYNGLNWKIKRTNASGLSDCYYYYNDAWQCVEEKHASSGAVLYWYAHGSQYIDDLVVRNTGGSIVEFSVQDARFNVVTRLDSAGVEIKRYRYDGYGLPKEGTTNWSTWSTVTGDHYLFQGRQLHKSHAQYDYRNRVMDPGVGVFVQRDPIGIWGDEAATGNGYYFEGGDPINSTDSAGLLTCVLSTQNAGLSSDTQPPKSIRDNSYHLIAHACKGVRSSREGWIDFYAYARVAANTASWRKEYAITCRENSDNTECIIRASLVENTFNSVKSTVGNAQTKIGRIWVSYDDGITGAVSEVGVSVSAEYVSATNLANGKTAILKWPSAYFTCKQGVVAYNASSPLEDVYSPGASGSEKLY